MYVDIDMMAGNMSWPVHVFTHPLPRQTQGYSLTDPLVGPDALYGPIFFYRKNYSEMFRTLGAKHSVHRSNNEWNQYFLMAKYRQNFHVRFLTLSSEALIYVASSEKGSV